MKFRFLLIFINLWIDFLAFIPMASPVNAEDFSINRVVFTTGCTFGYRQYALRSNNIFKFNSSMILYIEPLNCEMYRTGATYTAKLAATARIKSLTKPGVPQNIELGDLKFVLPKADDPLYADVTLNGAGDLPIDLYEITLTLLDKKTQKSASYSRKFRVGHSYIKAAIDIEKKRSGSNGKHFVAIIKRATPIIYCNYRVRRMFANSALKMVLIGESVAGKVLDTALDTYTTKLENQTKGSVEFSPAGELWDMGNYRLEIYLGDQYEHALQFRVE